MRYYIVKVKLNSRSKYSPSTAGSGGFWITGATARPGGILKFKSRKYAQQYARSYRGLKTKIELKKTRRR